MILPPAFSIECFAPFVQAIPSTEILDFTSVLPKIFTF